MALNRERITLNPLEESANNTPLELGGDRWGHGVFIQPGGSQWTPAGAETVHLAQSVDTEGGLATATTVGVRNSPVLKIQVIEPTDPASTNYFPNPQMVGTSNLPTQNAATGSSTKVLIRDLVGYDYAMLQHNPGTNNSEGLSFGLYPVQTNVAAYTFGAWAKGVVGGETLVVGLLQVSQPGNVVMTTVTTPYVLTTQWGWYTATIPNWTTGNDVYVVALAPNTVAESFYTTGWCVVPDNTITESFDGTFPGCSWSGTPHASFSTRPAPGGPRLNAIMADVEQQVTTISKYRRGTVRRITPALSANNLRVTYDLVNAQLSWDDTSQMNAGVAKGTISCMAEPYGRGPELTTQTDTFATWPTNWTADAGATSNYVYSGTSNILWDNNTNLTVESRLIANLSPYPFYVGEVQCAFAPGATINGFKGGVIMKRWSATTYLEAYVTDNGTSSFLKIDEVLDGTRTNVGSVTLAARIANGTAFTVRFRMQRQNNADNLYAEYFANNSFPAVNTFPTNTIGPFTVSDYRLSGAEASGCGVVAVPQSSTNFYVANFFIKPYLARERTLPVLRFGLVGVPGTAPGLGRMVVSDASTNDQFWCQWGMIETETSLQATTYTDLFFEAESMTPAGGATVTGSPPAGASGGSAVYLNALLLSNQLALLTTTVSGTQLQHVGDYEVMARVYVPTANTGTVTVGFLWSLGDFTAWNTNPTTTVPQSGQWCVISLGTVHLPRASTGSQQWQGRVTSSSTAVQDSIYIDCLWLRPVTDGGGTAKGVAAVQTPSAYSSWAVMTGSGALAANLTGTGATWTTGGASGDWTVGNSFLNSSGQAKYYAQRNLQGDASTGSTPEISNGHYGFISVAGANVVHVDMFLATPSTANGSAQGVGVFSSATTYVLGIVRTLSSGLSRLEIGKVTAGTGTYLAFSPYFSGFSPSSVSFGTIWWTLQFQVDSAGRMVLYLIPQTNDLVTSGTTPLYSLFASDSAVNYGGTGKGGMWSWMPSNTTWGSQGFTNFWAAQFTADAAFYSGQQMEIRSDQARRLDSTGTFWMPESSYVGQYMKTPVAPYGDSFTQVMVKSSRNDISTYDPAIDAVEAQVNITPRYAQIPND